MVFCFCLVMLNWYWVISRVTGQSRCCNYPHFCLWDCLKNFWRVIYVPWGHGAHAFVHSAWFRAEMGRLERLVSLHQQVVWQESYRKSLCGCRQPAPILKTLRLLRPGLHFLPQQHLNSASHFTQNEGYVSQTGSNWPLPWFPCWKEQSEKGGARRGSGCVTWLHREMPDVMWCVFGRAINTHTLIWWQLKWNSAVMCWLCLRCLITVLSRHLWPRFNTKHPFVCILAAQRLFYSRTM